MSVTYSFGDIKLEVAENVGYDDGVGNIRTGKDLTATIIEKYINRRYYLLVSMLMAKYPEDYEVPSYANFYKTTGTVSSVSTTTLVAGSIFSNDMVGDTIYNSTTGTSAIIYSYTSATTVVMATDISTWSASNTIYVLGHEFILGGDAANSRYIKKIEVKYNSTDDWIPCNDRGSSNVYRFANEIFYTWEPQCYKTNKLVNGVNTMTIGILPEPTTPITRGIKITRLRMPKRMDSDADIPETPIGSHQTLIYGATIDALYKLKRVDEVAAWENDWKVGVQSMMGDYSRSRIMNKTGNRTNHYLDMRRRYS